MIALRPFQQAALAQYRAVCSARGFGAGGAKIGIAPTAFGKSVLMGYLAGQMCPKGWRVIILAHREALVAQNAAKVSLVAPGLVVGCEIGKQVAAGDVDVVSASIASVKGERALRCAQRWRGDGRKILLCTDEAHHALAETYATFFAALAPDEHLGLTATPFRGDGESLTSIYPVVGFQIHRGEMIDGGWLARPHHFAVETQISIRSVRSRAGDYAEKELAKALDTEQRNELIIAAGKDAAGWLRHQLGQPVAKAVCFALSVEHCHTLAEGFRTAGWQAYAVDGKTPIPERRFADHALRTATTDTIVVSCGVLTEGWDVEQVNLGLFARPTKSPVLADQMLGRVLRWLEEKPGALIIDLADRDAEDRVTLSQGFRLPRGWTAEGRCLRQDELWFRGALERVSIEVASAIWGCTTRGEVEALLEHPENAKFRRLQGRDFLWWELGEEVRLVFEQSTIVVAYTPQGEVTAELRRGLDRYVIAQGLRQDEVCRQAELWLEASYPTQAHFLRAKETFRPATAKQLEFLKRAGVPYEPGITMHQAGSLINASKMAANKALETGIVGIGKHKGKHVSEVPSAWLKYMVYDESMKWLRGRPEFALFSTELDRRVNGL